MHTVLVALLTGAALALPTSTVSRVPPSLPAPPIARARQEPKGGKHQEKHPEIRRAMKALQSARNDLQHAASDYGGHRVQAIKSIDEALEHLKQALAFDTK